jgi:membrane protease subunit (stomatin/prohibitin family)
MSWLSKYQNTLLPKNWFKGSSGQFISPLRPSQEQLFSQYQQSINEPGAGGMFGDIADFYREMSSPEFSAKMEAPLMRQFNEDIMPGIAEQFAGMGAGGLSSSGFVQESGRAATDLAERLGSLRSQLRMQSAQGMKDYVQGAFNPMDMYKKRQPGLLEQFLEMLPMALTQGAKMAAGGF